MLESYRTTCDIRLARWRYRQRQAELEAAYKEMDEGAHEVFSKSGDEEDIARSATAVSRRMSAGAAGSEEEYCLVGRCHSGPKKATTPLRRAS